MEKILTTPKYKPVPMPEDLIEATNKWAHLPTRFKSIMLIMTIIQLNKIISVIPKMTTKSTVMT